MGFSGCDGVLSLLAGSPAIDHVPPVDCVLSTDQRGVLRPQGLGCDVGAYETAHACAPPPPNMVAWWPLDEQAGATVVEDIAGGHHGTPSPGPIAGAAQCGIPSLGPESTSTWSPVVNAGGGKVSDGMYFCAQSQNRYVQVLDDPRLDFDTSDMTIDAWVFITQYNLNSIQPIVEKMEYVGTTPHTGYRLYLDNGEPKFQIYSAGTGFTLSSGGSLQLSQNVWHYIAVTVDRDFPSPGAGDVNIYVDGSQNLTFVAVPDPGNIASSADLLIGGSALGLSGNYLNIGIDEVEIFDRALSSAEILGIFAADTSGKCRCTPPPPDMVAWYTGDDTTPIDHLGQHDGTFVGFPISAFDWKVGGGALETHAPDTYVIAECGTGLLSFGNPGQSYSIDAWINTVDSSGIRPIVDKRLMQGNKVFGYRLFLNNGLLAFTMADGAAANPICDLGPPTAGSSCTDYFSSANVADGLWHLVAVTVQRTGTPEVKLYVGGALVLTGVPRLLNANNSACLQIGGGYPIPTGPQTYLTGLIDELEFFNRALTPDEIQAIHFADVAGKCKCAEPPSDMVAWWPLDETVACNGCPVRDIVAGLNDGAQFCTVTPGPGEVGGAFQMTGAGYPGFSCPRGFVTAPPGPQPGLGAGGFTIDAWIKPNPCTSCFPSNILCHPRPIVSNRAGIYNFTATNVDGFEFFVAGPAPPGPAWGPIYSKPTPGWLGISLPPTVVSGPPQTFFSSSNPIVDDVWQHVAVTVDTSGPSVKFFHNGVLIGSSSYVPVSVNTAANVALGHMPVYSGSDCSSGCGVERYFNGWLDEIEVFSRPLNNAEIAAIYGAGPHGKCKPATLMLSTPGEGEMADPTSFSLLPTSEQWEAIGDVCQCTESIDCDDGYVCSFDKCLDGACFYSPNGFGDVDHNGTINLADLFCVLDGFSDDFSTCPKSSIDIEPCEGNGTINLADLFAVLDAFSDVDPCCGTNPAPMLDDGYDLSAREIETNNVILTLAAGEHRMRPGHSNYVDVFAEGLSSLRGYEFAVEVTGGRRGQVTVESIEIDTTRADYVFAGDDSYVASDVTKGRAMSAVYDARERIRGRVYLGTVELLASKDARGTFKVSLVTDGDKTFLAGPNDALYSPRVIGTVDLSVR